MMKSRFFMFFFVFCLCISPALAVTNLLNEEEKTLAKLNDIHHGLISTSKDYSGELKKIIDAYEKKDLHQKTNFYLWLYAKGLLLDSQFTELWYKENKNDEKLALISEIMRLNDRVDEYYQETKFHLGSEIDSNIMMLYGKNYLYIFFLNRTFINFGLQMNAIEYLLKYAILHNPKNVEAKRYLVFFYMGAGSIRYRTMGLVSRFFVTASSILKSVKREDMSEENQFFVHFLFALYYYYLGYKETAIEEAFLAKSIYSNSRYNVIMKNLIIQTMGDVKPLFPLTEDEVKANR